MEVQGQPTSGGGGDSGFGWNPLTDFMKVTSGVGDFINAHTKIGSFNPGIGSLVSSITNFLPGMANVGFHVGKSVVTGHEGEAVSQLAQVGQGLWHGAIDTATDVATLGGMAPWTNAVENQEEAVYGYKPSSLKQYATSPGQGLGGAVFNDAANVLMAADGAGAVAKLGEVGKAADLVAKAEQAARVSAIDAKAPPAVVEDAGKAAREAEITSHADRAGQAGGDPQAARAAIEGRLKTLDRINTIKDAASLPLQPWKALRPLQRAAAESYGPQTAVEAPVTPGEAPRTQAPEPKQGAVQGGQEAAGGKSALQQAMEAAVKAQEAKTGTMTAEGPQPGYTRLYNGGGGDRTMWTSDVSRAESFKSVPGAGEGAIRHIDVPDEVAAKLKTEPGTPAYEAAKGHQPNTATDYYLGDHKSLINQAVEHEAQPVPKIEPGELPSSNAQTASVKLRGITKQMENVPRAYTSYLEHATPVRGWAKTIVEHLPEPIVRSLAWMDAHHQRIDYQTMTRQQQRALAVSAREIENRPDVQALKEKARQIVQAHYEGVTPTVASNIVGQLVRAYITHGKELIDQLEGNRQEMEAARPGEGSLMTDAQLGYSFHIPDELNTPEFRDSIFQMAEPIKQLRQQASDNLMQSQFLRDKGLVNLDMPLLTKSEKRQFNQAMHKLQQAAKLESVRVPKELAGVERQLVQANDAVGSAVRASQLALETANEAKTDFDRSRYVPQAINTPEKLAAVTNDLAERTIREGGGTYDPTSGSFVTMADGTTQGYLVGALAGGVATMSLADFTDLNPDTGRMRGAETIDKMVHAYQEAFQFPHMTVGTWVDDDGIVHIDPAQFLQGDSARDRALTLGAAREQQSVKEVHTGDTIPVTADPNTAAYFVKDHAARDLRGRQLRQLVDKQIEAGGHGLNADDVDRYMAFLDKVAVEQSRLHPEKFSSPDAFYRSFKIEFAQRKSPGALSELRSGNLLGQFLPSAGVAGGTIRLFQDGDIATLTHESGHLLRQLTTGDDLRELEQAYGVRNHNWTPEAEEKFTHDFTLATSKLPAMDHLKEVLASAYGEFGEPMAPEVDGFWQKTLAPAIQRVEAPGYELATGEKLIGIEGRSEQGKTMPQRQQQLPNVSEDETKMRTYTRGAQGEEAIQKWRQSMVQKRTADAAAARAQQHVTDLEKVINERLVPAQATANMLRGQATRALDKLGDKLEDPAISRVPPRWQPIVTTARKIAADIEKYPELEPILEAFPKTFGAALDFAAQQGFTPEYMPDLTPARVRDLIAGTARLGGQGSDQMGHQFTSGARRVRRGTLQRVGGYDNSIEALVAGLNQHVQEERTNMVVDWVDRVAARDLPVNAAGQRLGSPPGWVEWDPIRRGMLAVETPGGERVSVGATKMIPKAVSQAIKEYAGSPPTNPIYRGLKTMTDPWRALMLTLNPGFYLRHFQGHVMLAAVAGGVNPSTWVKAFQEARKGFVNMPEVTGLSITNAEIHTPGLVQWPSLADAMKVGGTREAMGYLAQKMHNVISTSDSFARAVAYISKKSKGYTDMQAMQYAMDALIDYGNMSNTERYMARAVIPFYSFSKGVLKIAYRMPMDHPLAASMMLHLGQWQEEQAVDDQGNPLPERYQGVVDLPLLGKTDMQKFSPFKDLEVFTSPEGLVSSLQFAVQDVVRAGLGVPAPGTKATVKVDKYGRLVPDVSLASQLGASVTGGPQGQLLQTGGVAKFFGIPTVSQDTLNKAGARNVLSQGELAASDQKTQQAAAAVPVDTQKLQIALQNQMAQPGQPLNVPQLPNAPSTQQVQTALAAKQAAQQAQAKLTRATSGKRPARRRSGGGGGGHKAGGVHKVHAHIGRRRSAMRSKLRKGFARKVA